jgi:PAS domain S-box-containing protein
VRFYLILLTLGVALPLISLAFYVNSRVAAAEREATQAALLSTAHSLAAAVNQELEKHIAVAVALAHSRAILDGNWSEFSRQAKASLADEPSSWTAVVDPAGQIMASTNAAPGTQPPRRPLFAAEQRALSTDKPQISGVETGYVPHRRVVFVAIPVDRDNKPVDLVDLVIDPARFQLELKAQHFASDWLSGILDSAGNFVARLPTADAKLGEPASTGWREAIRERPEGVSVHNSLQGYPVISVYAPTDYGWTVGVAIKQSELEAPLRRTQLMLLAASLGCIGLGGVLVWLIARRLHRSAKLLHGAAQAMASEQPVSAVPTGVREYDEAVAAFAAASQALHGRAQERDRAEAALRAHEADLEAVINRTPFMLARCGRDLRYRFVSEGFARFLGRKAEDLVGKPMVEVLGADAFKTILPMIARVLNGERVERENDVHYEGTGRRFIHVVAMPETDAHGEIIGWVASMLDITERKRAEQERLRAEAALARNADEQTSLYEFTNRVYRAESLSVVYQAALDSILRALHCSRASVLRVDESGVMRFVAWRGLSDRYRAAADGYAPWPADEAKPRPVCISNVAHADLPEPIGKIVKEEGIGALSFIPLMSSDGKLAGEFIAAYAEPHTFTREEIDLALNLARRFSFATERMLAEQARQLAEQELRQLKEKLETEVEERTLERDRIWQVSEDLLGVSTFEGYFTSINPAWTRLLGWSEAEIKSMHVSELRHPDDAPVAIAARAELANGASSVRIENRFRHKDGSWRWIQWTMTAENGLLYISGRHVTLEREAATALERARMRSAHSQKMEALGALTGGVAHDFNNLLMIVSGHAQTLKRRLSDPRDKRALDAIQIAATRGESLTRQLLAFSRGMPLNPTVISPAETIEAIRDVLSGSLHVNVTLSIDVAQTTWPVRVDKSELELALLNLTVNARDAMPDGGRLSIFAANVSLHPDDTPEGIAGDFVAISVADNGCGIPEEVLGRVFEPFFTTKGADKGTGLGLSQVYGFARRSGGTVVVRSQVQRGTTATIYLPRSHANVETPVQEDTGHHIAPADATVLVVEDNDDVRAVAVSLLEQLGYRTISVENAHAALEALASPQPISVIFSDVVLPGEINGLSLARTVKARYPAVPVVLTTGYARVFETEPEFPVLRKPYQISALSRVVREALDSAVAQKTALAG